MCAHILVNWRALWLLQGTPNRSKSGDDDLLRSLPYLRFNMRGWGGFWHSPITEFFGKSLDIVNYWSILGSMGYLNVIITHPSFYMINS